MTLTTGLRVKRFDERGFPKEWRRLVAAGVTAMCLGLSEMKEALICAGEMQGLGDRLLLLLLTVPGLWPHLTPHLGLSMIVPYWRLRIILMVVHNYSKQL